MTRTDSTMQALVLHAVGDARLEAVARPTPGDGAVLVRVGYCGVCGSDIPRTFVKGTYSFPTICGHEFAGTIETCGGGVEGWSAGDRVTVFPLIWCGKCPPCEQGSYAQCHKYDYLGSRSDGAFAQYVVAPARNLLSVPEGVSLQEAAMTEPAAVALHALRRTGGALVGQSVAVWGAGPIGLMVAQWARAMGASQILLFDVVAKKIEFARSLGFENVIDSRQHDPVEAIESATQGQGADVCVEAAGVPVTMIQALKAVRSSGEVVLLGNPAADVTLPAPLISTAMRREVNIRGTWNSRYSFTGDGDDWHAALKAMASKAIDLKGLITHEVALEGAFGAMQMMKENSEFYCKVLIRAN
ncbi:MAG: galactitol-1-phosphate 5-dehydrogenase [Planctomycetes bacterium]|nr:galactitol-1-phosphate 5-dehydrogenase [Planctomycetota bacterium]